MSRPRAPKMYAAPVPWADPTAFAAVNSAIAHLIDRHASRTGEIRAMAEAIAKKMTGLFPVIDTLCAATCPWCPDPCCLSATVWLDLKDLLFLHLTDSSLPDAQPMRGCGDTCRHIGPKGCRLPRLYRPWICTWYLCATQTARFRRMPPPAQEKFNAAVSWVRNERKTMESLFIRLTAR